MGKTAANIKDFFVHPTIQLALVLGACILILALFSKYALDGGMGDGIKSIPGLVAFALGSLSYNKKLDDKWKRPWIANTATILVTVIIIAAYL